MVVKNKDFTETLTNDRSNVVRWNNNGLTVCSDNIDCNVRLLFCLCWSNWYSCILLKFLIVVPRVCPWNVANGLGPSVSNNWKKRKKKKKKRKKKEKEKKNIEILWGLIDQNVSKYRYQLPTKCCTQKIHLDQRLMFYWLTLRWQWVHEHCWSKRLFYWTMFVVFLSK